MSDGVSDSYKGEAEFRSFAQHLASILAWLRNPTEENFGKIPSSSPAMNKAYQVIGCPEDIASLPQRLKDGDKETWARLLTVASHHDHAFETIKEMSPFKDQTVVIVDYGMGFVRIQGEMERLLNNMVKERGWKTYDCDKYVIMLPKDIPSTEAFWAGCGIIGMKGPRASKV